MKNATMFSMAGISALSIFFGCSNDAGGGGSSKQSPESVTPGKDAEMTGSFYRHPLYLAADKLKTAFFMLGFKFADNGEGLEIEKPDVTFATWEEPADMFGWQKDPIYLGDGTTLLRTRILPAQFRSLTQRPPIRMVSFGRVYKKSDAELPMHSQIEGFVIEEGLTLGPWQDLWNQYAVALFGLGSSAFLESAGNKSYRITVRNQTTGKVFDLGFTGLASADALEAAGIASPGYTGWVFVIDVEEFALQYLSLPDRTSLYNNDISFLSRFKSDAAAAGLTPEYRAVDALRKLGYLETCGDTIYPDGIYVKMNMIQAAWDKNNQAAPLAKPLGDLTAMRTVLPPALEKILALNYERGASNVRVFEVGHIYLPIEGHVLPKEHFSISMGSYGPDVALESFTRDVEAVLRELGVSSYLFAPTDIAIAYKTDECLVILDGAGKYMDSNFGRINETATKNFGIGVPAYMAQMELNSLVRAGRQQRGEIPY
jgi:phenylalanyl-tRNA synthetase alpha subunit